MANNYGTALQKQNADYVDQFNISHDFYLPPNSKEIQTLTSGTITTLTSSLTVGRAYSFQSLGGTSWITLNGNSPTLVNGTGSNSGVPIPNGGIVPYFIARSGSTTVKASTADVGVILVLFDASSVGL